MGQAIVSLRLDPVEGTIPVGAGLQLSLFGATRRGETSLIPANLATWSSSNRAVAEVTRQGRVTPARPGPVTITVRYGGHIASAAFAVVAAHAGDA